MKYLNFLHIPRTAGTSLRAVLFERFEKTDLIFWDGVDNYIYDDGVISIKTLEEFCSLDLSKLPRPIRILGGHIAYGDIKRLSERNPTYRTREIETIYCAVLRDPVERLISYWKFCHANASHKYYSTKTFEEEFSSCSPFFQETRNECCYYIGGTQYFCEAKKIINENNFMIATSERIGHLIKAMCEWLGHDALIEASDLPTLNIGAYSGDDIFDEGLKKRIQEFLEEDSKLYEFVKAHKGLYVGKHSGGET